MNRRRGPEGLPLGTLAALIAGVVAVGALVAVPAVTQSAASSPSPIYGVTIDTVSDMAAVVSGIEALPYRPTVRVVFTWDKKSATPTPPADYSAAVSALDPVATVMAELLDSTFEATVPVATYTADVKNYLATLGSTVGIWEIGNEVNGNWTGPYATVASRIVDAYDDVDAAHGISALTLFANEYGPTHCGDGTSELTPVEFSTQFVPASVRDGLSYVFESYYPTTCGTVEPTSAQVASEMEQLHSLYPNAELGFGELGLPTAATPTTESRAAQIMSWGYSLDPGLSYYVGGYFWWYAYEDCFTGSKLLASNLVAAFQDEHAALGGGSSSKGVTITTTALPEGSVGSTYQAQLKASGGSGPYAWSSSGTLPQGLSLDTSGGISGTPTQVGTSTFSVTVRAATSETASTDLSITVVRPPPTPVPAPTPPPKTPPTTPPSTVTRIAGYTADATAVAELEHQFPPNLGDCPASRSVVLATDGNFPDALASAYLARYLGTGTLLTPGGILSAVTVTALHKEGISTVYVVGGPLAISTAVTSALEATTSDTCGASPQGGTTITVSRIFGQTEYDTAAMVAEYAPAGDVGSLDVAGAYAGRNATGGDGMYNDTSGAASSAASGPGALPTAILATGVAFQDAESASALSYADRLPILVTTPSSLSPQASSAIQLLGIKQVIMMGGPLAVSDGVVSSLQQLGVSVLRVAGHDDTDTAVQLARFETGSQAADDGAGWAGTGRVVVARGDYFTDGLAGAVVAADGPTCADPMPLLLTVDPTTVGPYLTAFLQSAGTSGIGEEVVTSLDVLGGTEAITATTVDAMAGDLRG